MTKLSDQHKRLGILSLEVAIIAQFFILTFILPSLPQFITYKRWINDFVVFILTSTTLYLFLAKLPLYLFEKFGWRLFNKNIDFHGVWNYRHFCYPLSDNDRKYLKEIALKEKRDIIERLKENHGKVFFKQSVFDISVQQGTGILGHSQDSSKTTWRGISVNYDNDGSFVVHFESTLTELKFQGIDTLTVDKWDKNGRPLILVGQTILIAENTNHVLRGEITYSR